MKIDHIAIWVNELEKMRAFYEEYFGADSNQKYHNPRKNFTSYFLTFDSGARLEIMHRPDIKESLPKGEEWIGITHLAISVGSKKKVDQLTKKLRDHGFSILGEPRITGDGYYESVILDPEGNRIEITV